MLLIKLFIWKNTTRKCEMPIAHIKRVYLRLGRHAILRAFLILRAWKREPRTIVCEFYKGPIVVVFCRMSSISPRSDSSESFPIYDLIDKNQGHKSLTIGKMHTNADLNSKNTFCRITKYLLTKNFLSQLFWDILDVSRFFHCQCYKNLKARCCDGNY